MMADTDLDALMRRIRRKFNVEVVPLTIGGKIIKILQLQDFERYIEELVEKESPGAMDLPYWAKIWDASFVLAHFLGKQPVVLGQRLLEIGAGIGIVGLYAALCGHRVTISDINEDALLFAQANVLLNGLTNVEVRRMDWNTPDSQDQYDVIIGSEVVYDRSSYPALVNFLRASLAPDGIIFLSKNAGLKTPKFFTELTKYFEFKQTIQTIRKDGEAEQIVLYAIRRKKDRPNQAGDH